MKTFRRFFLLIILTINIIISSCSDKAPSTDKNTDRLPEIITVNAPLQYFTEQLASDLAQVTMIAETEGDPADWQPNIDEALRIQQAELVILNGAGYSKWPNKVAISGTKLINTSQAFSQDYIELDNETTHSHGPTAEHSHGELAFTTWMDTSQAIKQAQAIARALENNWPEDSQSIRQREDQLIAELTKLDKAYQQQAKQLSGKTIIYSHPVYQYFERRYQLEGTSLHWEPNELPTENEWLKLKSLLGNAGDGVLIWEDTPSTEIKARMQSMGLMYIVIKPAAKKEANSWEKEQQDNILRLTSCCSLQ